MLSEELKMVYFGQSVSNSRATIFALLASLKSCQLGCLYIKFLRIKFANKCKALKKNIWQVVSFVLELLLLLSNIK